MIVRLLPTSALAVMLGLTSQPPAAEENADIVDTLRASRDHTIMATAIQEAGLIETLKGKGPFTLFAPTDAAFRKLGDDVVKKIVADKELLRKIVLAHVVRGKALGTSDLKELDGQELNGFPVSAKDVVKVGNATVVRGDLRCSNGIIHVVDAALTW